jgi:hypothetical protein
MRQADVIHNRPAGFLVQQPSLQARAPACASTPVGRASLDRLKKLAKQASNRPNAKNPAVARRVLVRSEVSDQK